MVPPIEFTLTIFSENILIVDFYYVLKQQKIELKH